MFRNSTLIRAYSAASRSRPVLLTWCFDLGLFFLPSSSAHIFQISTEVGMLMVAGTCIPMHDSILVSLQVLEPTLVSPKERLFSSTYSGAEVIFCDYSFETEYLLKCFHFLITRKLFTPRARNLAGAAIKQSWTYPVTQTGEPDRLGAVTSRSVVATVEEAIVIIDDHFCISQFSWMRHNLMMTAPEVRATVKPSDEGTFGKCRNLNKGTRWNCTKECCSVTNQLLFNGF